MCQRVKRCAIIVPNSEDQFPPLDEYSMALTAPPTQNTIGIIKSIFNKWKRQLLFTVHPVYSHHPIFLT